MTRLILNRDFQHPADGWYQVESIGEHANPRFGIVQVVDQESIASIVNRFNQDAARPNFPGMLIDHEHFKHDPQEETIAYGWLNRLQARADGAYGQIRWTSTGRQAVDGGDYRFFSTEYDPADNKVLNSGKPARVRPMRLDGLTLTNSPNNTGGKPITNTRRSNSLPMNTQTEQSQAAAISAEAHVIINRTGCTWDAAWNRARQVITNRSDDAIVRGAIDDNAAARDARGRPVFNVANQMNLVRATGLSEAEFSAALAANGGEAQLHRPGDVFSALAKLLQSESKAGWDFCWQSTARRFPDLYAQMLAGPVC